MTDEYFVFEGDTYDEYFQEADSVLHVLKSCQNGENLSNLTLRLAMAYMACIREYFARRSYQKIPCSNCNMMVWDFGDNEHVHSGEIMCDEGLQYGGVFE